MRGLRRTIRTFHFTLSHLRPQIGRFRELYQGILEDLSSDLHWNDGLFQQNMEMTTRKKYVLRLPSNLQKRIVMMKIVEGKEPDIMVRKAISEIVATTDKSQVRAEGHFNSKIKIIISGCERNLDCGPRKSCYV